VQALQLDGRDPGPPSLQLPGAPPAEGFCLHCLHSAGPRGEFIQMPPSFVLQNSELAPVLTYGGAYVARTYTRKHRFGVHARALLQPCCFLVVCIRQYPGVGHSLSILRQLGGPALPGGDKLLLVQMAAPYLKVRSSSYYNIQTLFSP
jgi:hypothetical protein